MSIIPITVFFSLLLAGLFVTLFLREQRRRNFACAERDSLLPLADETPRPVTAAPVRPGCGCRRGERPPCAGCRPSAPADLPISP
jgi:hypothetical protein